MNSGRFKLKLNWIQVVTKYSDDFILMGIKSFSIIYLFTNVGFEIWQQAVIFSPQVDFRF